MSKFGVGTTFNSVAVLADSNSEPS